MIPNFRRLLLSPRIVLLLLPFLFVSAKCIENDNLRRASDGDWHIYGEIHNETDVQGAKMIVVGTLLDSAGNVIATGQAPICPFELSPQSFSVYDIRFHNSDALQPASHKVNVLSGVALASPLPSLDFTMSGLQAERSGDTVTITGTVRANQNYAGDYSGCAAFYDSAGKVVQQITIFGFGELPADEDQPLELPLPLIPGEAQTVRLWFVGPGDEPLESSYRAVMSGSIDID